MYIIVDASWILSIMGVDWKLTSIDPIFFFSKRATGSNKSIIKFLLNIKKKKLSPDCKLGNPWFLKWSRAESFEYILDRIEAKLIGWKSKVLSWAARSTLIKLILNSIPIYPMSAFCFPTKISYKSDQLTWSFCGEKLTI